MENRSLARVYIVDDNEGAIALLRRLLADYSVEIIGAETDTQKAMEEVIELEPDLLFIDVEMPEMSGLDFCSELQKWVTSEMKVVFYTGYNKYLLDAIRRRAFDYMLKPATKGELAKIMTRYYESRLGNIRRADAQYPLASPIMLVVNAMNEHTALHTDDIAYFRFDSERKLWEVVCNNNVCYTLRHKTTADVILNYSQDFVQIHKRFIVNVQKIEKIQDSLCILRPPLAYVDELRISKNYRHGLMRTFYNM